MKVKTFKEKFEEKYRVTPYRWLILLTFSFVQLASVMIYGMYIPVAVIAAEIYDTDVSLVNFCYTAFLIISVPMTFPANYIIDTYGPKASLTISVVFNLTGAWIRLFSLFNPSFTPILIGTLVAAMGSPFSTNAATTVALRWFGD